MHAVSEQALHLVPRAAETPVSSPVMQGTPAAQTPVSRPVMQGTPAAETPVRLFCLRCGALDELPRRYISITYTGSFPTEGTYASYIRAKRAESTHAIIHPRTWYWSHSFATSNSTSSSTSMQSV